MKKHWVKLSAAALLSTYILSACSSSSSDGSDTDPTTNSSTDSTTTAPDSSTGSDNDTESKVTAIFTIEEWNNPGRQLKLCSEDLEVYKGYIRQEEESLERIVKERGFDTLTDRQKVLYKN